jgi:ABC-type uncharacterized transport system substrate-binding protein
MALAARAQQQRDRVRRVSVLIPFREDAETLVLVAAFKQRFEELGWTEGRNVQLDYSYTDGNSERTRSASAELLALAPDAILAYANPAVASLMQLTHTIPIVFTQASDPVGSGFVSNLAHPGVASCSIDGRDLWREAASYIDRILRGQKPGDLPVQLPTKNYLVINLKAAKASGFQISEKLLVNADEVIE